MEPETPLDMTPKLPQIPRLHRQRILLAITLLIVPLLGVYVWNLRATRAKRLVIAAAPLPTREKSSDALEGLSLPTTYKGVNRAPVIPVVAPPVPLPTVPPPSPFEAPTPQMASLEPQARAQAAPPPPPVPKPQAAPAPQPSPAPPPQAKPPPAPREPTGFFAKMEYGKPPFEQTHGTAASAAEGDAKHTLVTPATWTKPADPSKVLYRGQAIQAQTLHAIVSDIPGPVRVQVTVPVLSALGDGHVLIPQGSIILAKQEKAPGFGQARLPLILEEMRFPDGTLVALSGQVGDQSGAAGVTGKVDNHYSKLVLGTLLSAALSIGTRSVGGNPQRGQFQPNLLQEGSQAVAQDVNRTGQRIIDRQLDIPPSITVPGGSPVTILLDKNLSFARPPRRTP